MSHTAAKTPRTKEEAITNLEALFAAVMRPEIGMAHKAQNWFHTYMTRSAGNIGSDRELQKQCQHALYIPAENRKGESYEEFEIGVLDNPAMPGTYMLALDPFARSLDARVSDKAGNGDLSKLMKFYQLEDAKMLAREKGFGITEKQISDTRIVLELNTDGKLGSVPVGV